MDGFDGPVPNGGTHGSGHGRPGGPSGDLSLSGADKVMADYHQTMRQFLQLQERLMLAYLNGGERVPRPFSAPRAAPPVQLGVVPQSAATVLSPAPEIKPARVPSAAPIRSPAPPPLTEAAAAASVPVSRPAADGANPRATLLKLASEHTGYPEDMLGLDLNMEADLGIDSIKRVQILGALLKAQPPAAAERLSARMGTLSKAKSLREILSLVADALETQGETQRPFEVAGEGTCVVASLSRYVIRPDIMPLPSGQPTIVADGIYILVPDQNGLATMLARRLERDGARVSIVPEYAVGNENALVDWLSGVRVEGRIRGVIHLTPVRSAQQSEAINYAAWREGIQRDVKALFSMLRLAADDLMNGGVVLVASAMGGHFARDAARDSRRMCLFAGAGGGVGLIKCLAQEWPECRCKAIDLDPDECPEHWSEHIHAELAATVGRREVGYPEGNRTIFKTELAALAPSVRPLEQPDESWVVLAVGGARGITAESLREFAALRATCVIVGRSPLPASESAATANLPDAAALRTHFLAQLRQNGKLATPAQIEAQIGAVLRAREARANLDDFRAMGARVDYRACDARVEADMLALLEAVYEQYGRIDAVLFGAGLIEDHLLVNQTTASISRVIDTKVDSAFLIARHLRPETLKFFAFFTSVAGRYGNRGQTDYGAANEVLNRLAWVLQAQWGDRVKVSAINWGPWARTTRGSGMLTGETTRQFRERGINLIEPGEGRGFLMRELLYAPRDEVEVVAGEHPWEIKEAIAAGELNSASIPLGAVA